MIRLFIAIDVPEDFSTLICGLGGTIPGSRPVPLDQLHLTIKFIGEVESGRLDDIREALDSIDSPPFSLSLKGVGHFPPRGMPRVLWVGVSPVAEITALRNRIENTLFGAGIPREGRKFAPHITVARLKNSPLKRVGQWLAGNAMLETPPFEVSEFRLYASTLSAKGAIHTVKGVFPLRGATGIEMPD